MPQVHRHIRQSCAHLADAHQPVDRGCRGHKLRHGIENRRDRLDRQDVPGMLRIFDIANPDTAVHVRSQTTVPQQSLAVLNSPLVVEASRRLAQRALAEAGEANGNEFVIRLWRAALSRTPTDAERTTALAWLASEASAGSSSGDGKTTTEPHTSFDRHARLAQAVLATAEFQFID